MVLAGEDHYSDQGEQESDVRILLLEAVAGPRQALAALVAAGSDVGVVDVAGEGGAAAGVVADWAGAGIETDHDVAGIARDAVDGEPDSDRNDVGIAKEEAADTDEEVVDYDAAGVNAL
jgi:hypothetical protein